MPRMKPPRMKPTEEAEQHDRWLVSYADLVSLLFAFFVMMYAIASADLENKRQISNAIGAAFGKPPASLIDRDMHAALPPPLIKAHQKALQEANEAALQAAQLRAQQRREREQLTGIANAIRDVLAPLVAQGRVRVTQTNRGIGVEINASVLFAPGDARIGKDAGRALVALAAVLKHGAHAIQVEGHTDKLPINNTAFTSNWELSAVRAASVVRLFVEHGIAAHRLAVLGYGENQPVADNATAEGRLRNRRVQLMILAAAGAPVAPAE